MDMPRSWRLLLPGFAVLASACLSTEEAEPGAPLLEQRAALLGNPSITVDANDFGTAPKLTPMHRGLNFHIIGSGLTCWDGCTCPEEGFYDVDTDATFRALMGSLGLGSVRIAGGMDANYYDHGPKKSWISWARNPGFRLNADVLWSDWWNFHDALGRPALMTTGNVYMRGNPTYASWVPAGMNGSWVADYRARGLSGTHWEAGNEVYISDTVPGLDYISGSGVPYAQRACSYAAEVHAADDTARVGLVLYEHGSNEDITFYRTDDFLSQVASYCSLSSFDFFIIHDYAPLVPRLDSAGSPEFYAGGVERSLAYQDLVSTVAETRSKLATYPGAAGKPVYVTEYGLLFDSNDIGGLWESGWHDKGVALLLLHHYFDLITEGANGLWFWDALGKWNRLVDPGDVCAGVISPTPTSAYHLLKQAFAQQGKVLSVPVVGSPRFTVSGPVGSGCIEPVSGTADTCWWEALPSGSTTSGPFLRAFASYRVMPSRGLSVTLLNFSDSSQMLDLNLADFGIGPGTLTWERWSTSASGWDAPLASPTSSFVPKIPTFPTGPSTARFSVQVPARGVVILDIPLP